MEEGNPTGMGFLEEKSHAIRVPCRPLCLRHNCLCLFRFRVILVRVCGLRTQSRDMPKFFLQEEAG